MKKAPAPGTLSVCAAQLGGCAAGGIQNTDDLQQAMDANRKAAVSVPRKANVEGLPYL